MHEIAHLKTNLRAEVRARRATMTPEARQEESAQIVAHITRWLAENWLPRHPRESVGIYLATPEEASLDRLAEWLWQRDVLVAAPRVNLQQQSMTFHPLLALADAIEGPWKVRQPPALEAVEPKLIFVPGTAFDLQGGRLGMGGGWYDRTVTRGQYTVGVALRCQLVPSLPLESHDRPLNALVTPDSWHEFHPL